MSFPENDVFIYGPPWHVILEGCGSDSLDRSGCLLSSLAEMQ